MIKGLLYGLLAVCFYKIFFALAEEIVFLITDFVEEFINFESSPFL